MCIKLPCGYSTATLTKIIAVTECTLNFIAVAICMIFATILEARPDLLYDVANEKPKQNQEIVMLLELPHGVQTCFVLWILVNFIASLVLSIVLLRGAQERNLSKVRLWFTFTILSYILWSPVFVLWIIYSFDPVNVIFMTFTSYIFSGLCLFVIHKFMEDLKIENIAHRPGYKTRQGVIFNNA